MSIEKFQPSYDIYKERMEHLKSVVPEAFADGKINWEILKEALGNFIEDEDGEVEHYTFTWPGKRQARRLAGKPPQGTLVPVPGEGINEESTENIFIEGDNLEVLKLLQKSYASKIKMIYIDPPYNTGNDFIYSDNFTTPLDEYLKLTGQIDEKGSPLVSNKKADGRFHSKWLNMMYPRLRISYDLLCESGLIFINLDDGEIKNLIFLCDEIFGEENRVGCVAWKKTTGDNKPTFAYTHDNILIYSKNSGELPRVPLDENQRKQYKNPDNDSRGDWAESDYRCKWNKDERPNLYYGIKNPTTGEMIYPDTHSDSPRVWGCEEETHLKNEQEKLVWWGLDGKAKEPKKKRFLSEHQGANTRSVWLDSGSNDDASRELQALFPEAISIFDTPKPTKLLQRIIEIALSEETENNIFMDFFAGSCSFAHAFFNIDKKIRKKSKIIIVQIPEGLNPNKKEQKDAYKFCIDNKLTPNIAEIGKERIRRAITNIKKEITDEQFQNQDLGFKVFKLQKSHFNEWQDYKGSDVNELMDLFAKQEDALVEGWAAEDLIVEIMLQEGFPLHSKISSMDAIKDNKVIQIKSEFCNHVIFVCLDKKVGDKTINDLPLTDKDIFICLDKALTDQQKVSLSDKGVIKTI